jgi:hypothetical protein
MTRARRFLSFAFLTTITAASFSMIGCGRQQEGQRCVLENGDRDCADGLVCTDDTTLRGDDLVDRCCPEAEEDITDSRCAPRTTPIDGSGGSGLGGAGGDGSGEKLADVNGSCQWTSDCLAPLVCGPVYRICE